MGMTWVEFGALMDGSLGESGDDRTSAPGSSSVRLPSVSALEGAGKRPGWRALGLRATGLTGGLSTQPVPSSALSWEESGTGPQEAITGALPARNSAVRGFPDKPPSYESALNEGGSSHVARATLRPPSLSALSGAVMSHQGTLAGSLGVWASRRRYTPAAPLSALTEPASLRAARGSTPGSQTTAPGFVSASGCVPYPPTRRNTAPSPRARTRSLLVAALHAARARP